MCLFQINRVLGEAQQISRVDCIDREDLQLLVRFWKPFQEETTKLEGEDYPTLHLVVLSISMLKVHAKESLVME